MASQQATAAPSLPTPWEITRLPPITHHTWILTLTRSSNMGPCLAFFSTSLLSLVPDQPPPHQTQERLDLSWPAPPVCSVNGGTPTETYLGRPKKMHLPSAQDMVDLIKEAGTGCFLYCRVIARAYRQLPLDLLDWLLVCFMVKGKFYADISLLFCLQWATASCQDTTWLVARHLQGQGVSILHYIDDFGGVTAQKLEPLNISLILSTSPNGWALLRQSTRHPCQYNR